MTRPHAVLATALLTLLLVGCSPADAPQGPGGPEAPEASPPAAPTSAQRPVPADLRRLARAFITYGRNGTDTLPTAESVWIGLDGSRIKAVDDMPDPLTDRRIWRVCPAGATAYAAWSCPIDLLGPIRASAVNGTRLVLTRDTEVVCARVGRPRPRGRYVTIRPERMFRTCATDFAIVLRADARGRLLGVDLTVSEP